MRIAYADPPYINCAHLYRDHPDYAGEVDHAALIARLENEFDGWILHAAATPVSIAVLAPLAAATGARPDDELVDLYPGTGAVSRAWATWRGKFLLPSEDAVGHQAVEARK